MPATSPGGAQPSLPFRSTAPAPSQVSRVAFPLCGGRGAPAHSAGPGSALAAPECQRVPACGALARKSLRVGMPHPALGHLVGLAHWHPRAAWVAVGARHPGLTPGVLRVHL